MLDTNASSAAIRGDAAINEKLLALPPDAWCISTITMAEHVYGLAKKPQAVRLAQLVHAFLNLANVLTWDREAAEVLGVNERTAKRDWSAARLALHQRLSADENAAHD